MSLKINIEDGLGRATQARVEDESLLVSVYPSPPLLPLKSKVFTQFLTDDGLAGGTNDLGVDGSATSVNYWIPSSQDSDIYITKLNFLMGYGASSGLWKFADSAGALTNGVRVFYNDPHGVETQIFNAKTNAGFLRFALSDRLIPTAWELRHLGANNDYGILFTIDLARIMPPYGIKLDMGTNERLSIIIRDDCTDADTFNACAMGFERFE